MAAAAIGQIVLVKIHANPVGLGTWDRDQEEHPAIVTGTYADVNLIDAQVFVRNFGPAQKANVTHQDAPGAAATRLTWRELPE